MKSSSWRMFRRSDSTLGGGRGQRRRGRPASLQLESLEARQLFAADVDVAGLLFRGDLFQEGQRWVAPSGTVDVGFRPTGSEAFRPLFTVTGGTTIDVADTSVSFAGQGTVSGQPFFTANGAVPLALDIESLLGSGQFVAGSPFAWGGGIRGSTLKLTNPGGGDTSDTRIELSGAGIFSFGSGADGTSSPFALADLVASLAPTGDGTATATASGVFIAAGSSWTLGGNALSATLASWTATAGVAGTASVTIDGDPFTAAFTGDGLQVSQGAIAGLTATLDGAFTPGGASLAGNAWTATWSPGSLGITGSGTLAFGTEISGTTAATLPAVTGAALTVADGKIASAAATLAGTIKVAGSTWKFDSGAVAYAADADELRITGAAETTLNPESGVPAQAALTGTGLAITAGGVKSLAAQIAAGDIKVAGTTVAITDLAMTYVPGEDAIDFTGKAKITLDLGVTNGPWTINAFTGRVSAGAFAKFAGTVDVVQETDYFSDRSDDPVLKFLLGTVLQAKLNVGLFVDQASGLDFIQLTGGFNLDFAVVKLKLDTTNNGILLRNGTLEQFEAVHRGELSVGANKFRALDTLVKWVKATSELQISGSFEFYLGKKLWPKDSTGKPVPPYQGSPTDETLKAEAENVIILDLGTSAEPGLVIKNGALEKLDANVSAKTISLGFLDMKLNKAGVIYKKDYVVNGATVPTYLGFYGEVALSSQAAKTLEGVTLAASLGTRESPGIEIVDNNYNINNLKLYFGAAWSGPFQINELFFEWKKISTTEYTVNGGGMITLGPIRVGCELGFYQGTTTTDTGLTQPTSWLFDRIKINWEAAEENGYRGIPVKGVYIRKLAGELKNLQSPGDVTFVGTVGISAGPLLKLPGIQTGVQGPNSLVNVHPLMAEGRVTISKSMLVVDANFYKFAYYDVSYAGTSLDPWRHLVGKGTGTLTLDWTRDIYELKGNFTSLDLIRGEILLRLFSTESGGTGFIGFGSVEIKPEPNSKFDFKPVSWFNAKGSIFYVVDDTRNEFGAWGTIKIAIISATGGLLYDIRNETFEFLDSSEVKAYEKRARAIMNGTDQAFPWSREFDVEIPAASPNLHANKLSAVIPFSTRKIESTQYDGRAGDPYTIAEMLEESDIEVAVSGLPSGTSYRTSVSIQPAEDGVAAGQILVEVFPSGATSLDPTRTFAGLGLASLAGKVQVKLKQNSFLAADDSVVTAVAAKPNDYLTGVVFVDGKPDLAKADWDSTKQVEGVGILPTLATVATIPKPTIGLGGPAGDVAVHREINSFTNETLFRFTTNTSPHTRDKGVVSLQVIDQREVLAKRWLIQAASTAVAGEVDGATASVADARVVEMAEFSQQEIVANAADDEIVWTPAVGLEVLYFDATRTVRRGRIEAIGTALDGEGRPRELTLRAADGPTAVVAREKMKPLWLDRGVAKVRAAAGVSLESGVTYLASASGQAASLSNAAGGRDYFELFEAKEAIRFGVVPTAAPAVISSRDVRLAALPDAVGAVFDTKADKRSDTFQRSSDWTVTTLGGGVAVPVTAINGFPSQTSSASLPLSLFADGRQFAWTEDRLAPTPRYVFMTIDDKLHAATSSDFVSFTSSPEVTGKVLLRDAAGTEEPLAGVRAFFDVNGNEAFDVGERHAYTGPTGEYYFYDVATAGNDIRFELTANRRTADGGPAAVSFVRGANPVTVAPTLVVSTIYPLIKGRVGVDANANGTIDEGEQGFPLAQVVVTGAAGNSVTGLTNESGWFEIQVTEEFGPSVTVAIGGAEDANTTLDVTDPTAATVTIARIDYTQPKIFTTSFAVQAGIEFRFDPNQSFWANLGTYLGLFSSGRYTKISLLTTGFQFHVDTFQFLPGGGDETGLKTARGRAVFQGETLKFEFPGPRGLVVKGKELAEVNAKFSGTIAIFGAKLNLDTLAVRYVAADPVAGTAAAFRLTGSTELDIKGQRLRIALPGSGLVITEEGIQSLEATLSGTLKIGGQDLELGSLSASYNQATDTLRLTGQSQLLSLGSRDSGRFFGLDDVVLELAQGKIASFAARVSGSYEIEGASFALNNLAFQYAPQDDAFTLTGQTSLQVGATSLAVSLPTPGLVFSPAGVAINGKVTGTVVLGGSTLELNQLALTYGEAALRIQGDVDLTVEGRKLALASMDLRWKDGAFRSLSAGVGGEIEISQAVVKLDSMQAGYDADTGTFALSGGATLLLRQTGQTTGEDKLDKLLSISGSIGVKAGVVESLVATIQTGALKMAGGSFELRSATVSYSRQQESFGIAGSGKLAIAGGELTATLVAPGLVWKQGAFGGFSLKLAGLLPLQKDAKGKVTAVVEVKDFSAAYTAATATLALKGAGDVRVGNNRGILETDATGIVIVNGALQAFGGFLTLAIDFGSEEFTDANKNGLWDEAEKFTDANGNQKFDGGFAIAVSRAGLVYLAAAGEAPSRVKLSGKGRLDFDGPGPRNEGVEIDLSTTGIEVVGGEIENFTLSVAARFKLGSVDFTPGPGTSVGFRYQRALSQIDVFGSVGIKVADNSFAFVLGTGFENPGIRLQHGAITYASADITTSFGIGDLAIKVTEAGFTYDASEAAWAIYGSARLTNVFSIGVDLGKRASPGLLIRDNDWEIRNGKFTASGFDLGAIKLDEVTISLQKTATSWKVSGAAGLTLPMGIGAAGAFELVNGAVTSISVGVFSDTGIPIPSTPLFVTSLEGSIRNLDNLAAVSVTGRIGLMAGQNVTLFGKSARVAQFYGSFTLDASSLKLQADVYLGAVNTGTTTSQVWTGLIGEGTAVILVDWSRNVYYGDISATFLGGTFLASGRMGFSEADGLLMRGTARMRIPDKVPIIGGEEIAGAGFQFQHKSGVETYVMGWGQFLGGTRGLKYDVINDTFSGIGTKDLEAIDNRPLLRFAAFAEPSAFAEPASFTEPFTARTFAAAPLAAIGGPSSIDAPALPGRPGTPGRIDTGTQTTRLTGRVNDPTVTTVKVSLFYSLDAAGEMEFAIPLAGTLSPATGIAVPVNTDGSWSVDIPWDASALPSGDLWIYGQVDDDGVWVPVYGMSAGPFKVVRDIEGRIAEPSGKTQNGFAIMQGRPGVPVFADLDDDGIWDAGIEPRAISDSQGFWFLDVPGSDVLGGGGSVPIVYSLPDYVSPAAGSSARQVVTLAEAGATLDLRVNFTRPVISGDVFVDGGASRGFFDSLSQPVSGLAVAATGPDGRVYRVSTDNFGRYEIPVPVAGQYFVAIDFAAATFLGHTIRAALGEATIAQVNVAGAGVAVVDQFEVDSVGIVRDLNSDRSASLTALMRLANDGFVSSIEFDGRLRGLSITLDPPDLPTPTSYYVYDEQNDRWELITPPADNVALAGPSALVIRDDLRIRGGDLDITLKASNANGHDAFRAFHVLPGVSFELTGLRLEGFASQGPDGSAGRGGAIYNQGHTTIRDVTFVGNTARSAQTSADSGRGGAIYHAAGAELTLAGGLRFQANAAGSGPAIWTEGRLSFKADLVETNGASRWTKLLDISITNDSGRDVPVALSIRGADAARFMAADGALWLRPRTLLDSERRNRFTGLVAVAAGAINGPGAKAGAFTLDVTDVNEAPLAVQLSGTVIAENMPVGTVIGGFSTVDRDQGEFFTYSLVSGQGASDNTAFRIHGGRLIANESFNFEMRRAYSIRVRSTDRGGLFVDRVFTINVLDVPERRTGVDISLPAALAARAGARTTLLFSQAPFSDANPSGTARIVVTLRVAAGSIDGKPAGGVTVGGTATNRTFTGTLENLNRYFTDARGLVTYLAPLSNASIQTLTVVARKPTGAYSRPVSTTIRVAPRSGAFAGPSGG